MASAVEICNRALQHLGQRRVNHLEEPYQQARECRAAYGPVRDALIAAHPWNFATRRAELARLAPEETGAGPGPRYALPHDCLRLLDVAGPGATVPARNWQIEGNHLIWPPGGRVFARYLGRIQDPHLMGPGFRELLALRLALELAPTLAPGISREEKLQRMYQQNLAEIRHQDAQGSPVQIFELAGWLDARRGG